MDTCGALPFGPWSVKMVDREAFIFIGVSRPFIKRTSMSIPAVVLVVVVRGPLHICRRGCVEGNEGFSRAEVEFGG